MEQHVAASKSVLLDAVGFKGSITAPYCLGRAQISVHTSGATTYGAGASGSRVARFEIAAQAGSMIDLQSLVLTGTVHNRTAVTTGDVGKIQFLAPSLTGLMESARVLIGGVEISSMDYVARTEHILGLMEPTNVRKADYAAGFGMVPATAADVDGNYRTNPLLPATSRDVACTFRSLGILQSTSYLPLSMCPGGTMVLEVTWASNQRDCCNTASGFGTDWNVSNLVVHIDSLSMDASFLSSLSSHILAGHALQMQFPSLHTTYNSILSGDSQITLSRASSRLNQVLLTFGTDDSADGYFKAQNNLYIPTTQDLKARLVIGEKRYPATEDLTGLSLFYHRMRKIAEGTMITREQFASNSFVACFNLEAASQVQHTGVSTNNAPLNIFLGGLYGPGESFKANAMFTTTISDELLELTNRGVVVGN